MSTPQARPLRVYLVAGEASGDLLGARLMAALRKRTPHITFDGVGGSKMKAQGLKSLFPFEQLSIFGIAEIILHIPRIFWLIAKTFRDIRHCQPDIVITIDSPGFNFRLAERLLADAATRSIPRVHYVAPTVWAYKPERAKWVARLYHHLLLLLPFEPPYFTAENLPCSFIGHPVAWEWKERGDGATFRARHGIPADQTILCLLPGSRKGELKRLLPIFARTSELLATKHLAIKPVIVAATAMESFIRNQCAHWKIPPLIVSEAEKKDAFAAASIGLAKSGTVALELPLAGVPTVVTYKVSSYTARALKKMLRIPYANLINILLNEEAIPEMLQDQCEPHALSAKLEALLSDPQVKSQQQEKVEKALAMLGVHEDRSPSEKAADIILGLIHPLSR